MTLVVSMRPENFRKGLEVFINYIAKHTGIDPDSLRQSTEDNPANLPSPENEELEKSLRYIAKQIGFVSETLCRVEYEETTFGQLSKDTQKHFEANIKYIQRAFASLEEMVPRICNEIDRKKRLFHPPKKRVLMP